MYAMCCIKSVLQYRNLSELEGTIELWKLQYVSLIQSSIRFTGSDTMDDAELSLYGGDRVSPICFRCVFSVCVCVCASERGKSKLF